MYHVPDTVLGDGDVKEAQRRHKYLLSKYWPNTRRTDKVQGADTPIGDVQGTRQKGEHRTRGTAHKSLEATALGFRGPLLPYSYQERPSPLSSHFWNLFFNSLK